MMSRFLNVVGAAIGVTAALVVSVWAQTYNEANGVVAFEAESATLRGKWVLNTTAAAQYTGTGMIDYPGPSCTTQLSAKGSDSIGYSFKINSPGTYWLRLKMYHCCTNRGDIDNDQWIQVDNLGWYKYYHNGPGGAGCRPANFIVGMSPTNNDATNTTKTIFNLTAGVHKLGISARSYNCMVDRIHICKDSAYCDTANIPISPLVTGVIEPVSSAAVKTVMDGELRLQANSLKVNLTTSYAIQVVSLDGRIVGAFTGERPGVYPLSVTTRGYGLFFAKVSTKGGKYTVPLMASP